MKNLLKIAALAVLLSPSISSHGQNLVQNGSAEYYDTTTIIPESWVIVSGNWESTDHTGYTSSAHDSTHIFYEGADAIGTLQQDVNVTGYSTNIDASLQHFLLSAWAQSKNEAAPADRTTVTIQCLDASKLQVLYTWHSDTISSTNQWTQIIKNFLAPANTRFVRIQLTSIRNQGTENDGYFDDIALIPSIGTEVNNLVAGNTVSIAPNPVSNVLHVSPSAGGSYELKIATMMGAKVVTRHLNGPTNIDVSFLPAGMYFLSVSSADNTEFQTLKFVKE